MQKPYKFIGVLSISYLHVSERSSELSLSWAFRRSCPRIRYATDRHDFQVSHLFYDYIIDLFSLPESELYFLKFATIQRGHSDRGFYEGDALPCQSVWWQSRFFRSDPTILTPTPSAEWQCSVASQFLAISRRQQWACFGRSCGVNWCNVKGRFILAWMVFRLRVHYAS